MSLSESAGRGGRELYGFLQSIPAWNSEALGDVGGEAFNVPISLIHIYHHSLISQSQWLEIHPPESSISWRKITALGERALAPVGVLPGDGCRKAPDSDTKCRHQPLADHEALFLSALLQSFVPQRLFCFRLLPPSHCAVDSWPQVSTLAILYPG